MSDIDGDDTPLTVQEVEQLASFLGHAALHAYVAGIGKLITSTQVFGEGRYTFSVDIEASFPVHPQATVLLDRYRRSARVELL